MTKKPKYIGKFVKDVPGIPGIVWFIDSDIPDDKIYIYDTSKIAEEIRKKELERINSSQEE